MRTLVSGACVDFSHSRFKQSLDRNLRAIELAGQAEQAAEESHARYDLMHVQWAMDGAGAVPNGALELIGRVTGLLTTKLPAQNVAVTKITVVTTGDTESQRQAPQSLTVDGAARILPDEDSDES